jgi:ADP-heptose:LPS heptosyltransferase
LLKSTGFPINVGEIPGIANRFNLYFVVFLGMPQPDASSPANPGKTLIFCPIGLGNFIMATPCLEFLSHALGRGNLALLALKPGIRDMARESGFFGEVFAWDPDKQGYWEGIRVLRRIRKSGFAHSLALFPTSHWKFGLFALLSGIPSKVGFRYPRQSWPSRLQSLSLPLDPNAHDTDQNLRLAEAYLGRAASAPYQPVFPLAPAAPSPALAGKAYFVCHPGSSAERGMREKRMPTGVFADLIRRLHREFGLQGLLIGGPEEQALREEIAALAPEAAFLAPSRNLEEVAGQILGSRFFLGNDSGLMHVAAALGKKCLAFFGPTDERRTGPYGYRETVGGRPRHLILRRRDLACSPCWTLATVGDNPPCIYGDTRCLRDLSVEEAWKEIRDYVGSMEGSRSPAADQTL